VIAKEMADMKNLTYAVERLLDTGWTPDQTAELDHLPDGRPFPSVLGVQQEFAKVGLELRIKQNLIFNCYRATWGPAGEPLDDHTPADERHGTVIGSCPREASVYALAQLREGLREQQLAGRRPALADLTSDAAGYAAATM
jgi:hypothetical protein